MKSKYAKLFERGTIGKMRLKNRLIMAPMGTFTEDPDGFLADRTIKYYEARARGGASMIITEAQFVTNKTDPYASYITTADTDLQLKGWSSLSEAVHAHGAKLCIQLSPGLGRNAFIFDEDGGDMVSASENPAHYNPNKICRPMRVDEIKYIVEAFGRAARRCVTAEVDAIEIHAHFGYIFDQFMTPLWNRRTDEYGGSFENRMRFITECYNAIRNVTGPNFPIIVRIATEHRIEGGRTLEEGIEIIKYLEGLGVDAFDLDLGCYDHRLWLSPTFYNGPSCMAEAVSAVKKHIKVPILNSGNHTIDSAVEVMDKGYVDFIMMGRPLIADPDLPYKLFQGRPEDVRPCLFCNECSSRLFQNRILGCAVNPQAAAEEKYPLDKCDASRKVAVIGGGAAGLEAARVAAVRGHEVVLYEKSGELGGQLIPASYPSFKARLRQLVEYEKVQLQKLGVKVCLDAEINEDSPELKNVDNIIIALGAKPLIPPIQGINGPNVIEVQEAHRNPALVKGDTILVAGGGMAGCDAALELAMEGKSVTIVEMLDSIAPEVWNPDNRTPLLYNLEKYNVKELTGHKILEFTDKGALVATPSGEQIELVADTVIAAFGTRSERELTDRIGDKYTTATVAVGDGDKIGKIIGAVRGGFFAGWAVR
nr:FAD-dependent oxidoreductase [uncultured Clostridium sp.]